MTDPSSSQALPPSTAPAPPRTGNPPKSKTLTGEDLSRAGGFTSQGGQEGDTDRGSTAQTYDSLTGRTHDIVHDYTWTLSNVKQRQDIPHIILNEHRYNESVIKRQAAYYAMAAGASASNTWQGVKKFVNAVTPGNMFETGGGQDGLLQVYEEIFPDSPTNNKYLFPYFSKSYLALNTSQWEQIDDASVAAGKVAGGMQNLAGASGNKESAGFWGKAKAYIGAGSAAADVVAKAQYPVVGVFDRPRIFTSHTERTITIEFPLYNTKNSKDWRKNKNFLYLFMTQNLYNKRDYITGNSPVFYRVLVPGQYFCFAACVTNINVEHLGNMRLIDGKDIVPDAYQVSITLQEMVMPSLNQFQSIVSGEANNKVTVG